MFTTPCFVRVSRLEEREPIAKQLRDIGYKRDPSSKDRNNPYFITHPTHPNGPVFEQTNGYVAGFQKLKPRSIDCGTNEDLFLALAALRDDTDVDQWVTNGKDWGIFRNTPPPNGYEHWGNTEGIEFFGLPGDHDCNNYHKATPEELITHLKKDK